MRLLQPLPQVVDVAPARVEVGAHAGGAVLQRAPLVRGQHGRAGLLRAAARRRGRRLRRQPRRAQRRAQLLLEARGN